MKKIHLSLIIALLFLVTSCPRGTADDAKTAPPAVRTITAAEAHKMMAELDKYILLDVRTDAEYREAHIRGSILIPDTEIKQRAASMLPDKNAVIFVYCRTGRRSAGAAAVLASLGYKNIYDFGGIINWPYETE